MGDPVVGLVVPGEAEPRGAIVRGLDGHPDTRLVARWTDGEGNEIPAPPKPKRSHVRPKSTIAKGTKLELRLKMVVNEAMLAVREVGSFDAEASKFKRRSALESIALHLELAARMAREGV
jgi:hypothetical protein